MVTISNIYFTDVHSFGKVLIVLFLIWKAFNSYLTYMISETMIIVTCFHIVKNNYT